MLDGLQAFADAGGGHQAAVGNNRVGANDQHEIRVVDVWHRNQHAGAEHVVGSHVVWQLVGGGGTVAVVGAQRLEEPR